MNKGYNVFMIVRAKSTSGKMYSGGGDFTQNIDEYGGAGTADFVDRAIQIYCDKAE